MDAPKKTFDCIAMKRRGADKVQDEIADMSKEQRLAYWAKGTDELLTLQAALRGGQSDRE